ncbi:MAG: phage portal protein [Paenisporosarcina sp.]
MAVFERLRKAWNAFVNTETETTDFEYATTTYYGSGSPSRPRHAIYSERSIVSSIYTRISVDVAGILIKHCRIDDNGRYIGDVPSSLNECLIWEPNIDQSPRPFRQDIAMTLFDRGVAAVVPVDTTRNPKTNQIFDIYSLRVGEIITWHPKHVRLSVYNENRGQREEITLEKRYVAIIENPLYSVMNEPNSTLQRLIRKLGLLDAVDEASGSGKLDLIIQLPYVIKSEARRQQAEKRREDIEFQLKGSQYGIAYTDGTEKITQLNRPAENNLLKQVEYLTAMLYNQLGLTEEVMNGTANEEAMLNYFNRTIEPIVDAIIESMQRAFLGPQGSRGDERILYFRDPFKLVPVTEIAEIADKFTRNEILSANEIRHFIGIKPSDDPKADKLVNSNMPQPEETSGA